MGLAEMDDVGDLIARALDAREDEAELQRIKAEVKELATGFPLYPRRLQAAGA
jgi:glycine hydroxymethyltransferase